MPTVEIKKAKHLWDLIDKIPRPKDFRIVKVHRNQDGSLKSIRVWHREKED